MNYNQIYYIKNKDQISYKYKLYYDNTKTKVYCEICDKYITNTYILKHRICKNHIKLLNI